MEIVWNNFWSELGNAECIFIGIGIILIIQLGIICEKINITNKLQADILFGITEICQILAKQAFNRGD